MDTLLTQWNPSWDEMPWKALSSPAERFQYLPSFVLGEFLVVATAFLLLLHAARQGRAHLLLWALSLLTGTANDAFFMALPIVDNFWQSQACIMLTPRMPLYIPCAYVVFMYCGSAAALRMRAGSAAAAAATAGLLGELYYAAYDITGNKYLWWTWHDTDAPIRVRNLGAPVGSTVWVITFTATFYFLFRKFVLDRSAVNDDPDEEDGEGVALPRPGLFSLGSLAVVALSTPLMMVQMALLQLISGDSQGLPTNRSLVACLVIYGGLVGYGYAKKKKTSGAHPLIPHPSLDWLPRALLTAHYLFHLLNVVVSDPEGHVSTGVHQMVGPCDVTALDLAGQERQVYLCAENFTEDFTFHCEGHSIGPPAALSEWYTVCGTPHANFLGLLLGEAVLAAVGMACYRSAFTPGEKELREEARREQRRSKKAA